MALAPDELRTIRRALGLSQSELATELGVGANAVARWERGERPIPLMLRLALASIQPRGDAGAPAPIPFCDDPGLSRDGQIAATLRPLVARGLMPGDQTRVAEHFGVSRQRVNQILGTVREMQAAS